jgi:FkbM family methyltransferase
MEICKTELYGIKFEYYKNDSMAAMCVGIKDEWEPHITSFVNIYNYLHAECKIKNIIDVGANFGYHTIMFSREIEGNVYAFEPQIQNYHLLENNIRNNEIKNVTLYNHACGDTNCEIKMPINDDNVNMINMGDFTPNLIDNVYSVTKSVLLDEIRFPSKIDLIKIDVQGWEKKVLAGSRNLLNTDKPILIVEVEWFQLKKTDTTCEELFDYIRKQNYHIFYLEYRYPCDHICVHNDNLDVFRDRFQQYIFPHTDYNDTNFNINCGVNEKFVV